MNSNVFLFLMYKKVYCLTKLCTHAIHQYVNKICKEQQHMLINGYFTKIVNFELILPPPLELLKVKHFYL